MNIAQAFHDSQFHCNFTALLIIADEMAIDTEENYETEESRFTFEDDSIAYFDGVSQQITTI